MGRAASAGQGVVRLVQALGAVEVEWAEQSESAPIPHRILFSCRDI